MSNALTSVLILGVMFGSAALIEYISPFTADQVLLYITAGLAAGTYARELSE